jgi:hypothetical protein
MKAMRKSEKSTATKGNVRKHDLYKEAFARINTAIDENFFIEAIAILEAIISDRLKSHLNFHHKLPSNDKFYSLIAEWKKLQGKKNITLSINLPDLIDLWREQRNNAVHGFVSEENNVDKFLKNAEVSAKMGLLITRAVCDWHKREIKNSSIDHP